MGCGVGTVHFKTYIIVRFLLSRLLLWVMVSLQYRPDPGASNPFVAVTDGQGPSSRNWGCPHLQWLGADFSDGWPLFGRNSVPDKKISAGSMSRIGRRLEEAMGLPWQHIVKGSHLGAHYAELLELSTLRSDEGMNCIPSSSAIKPFQDLDGTGPDQDERALYPLSNPYTPHTPTRPYLANTHALSRESQTTLPSIEARSAGIVSITENPLSVISTKDSPSTVEPEQIQSPYCCEQSEERVRTDPLSEQQSVQRRRTTISPNQCTPAAQAHTPPPKSRSTDSTLQHSTVSFSS